MPLRRIFAIVGFVIGAFALILQFSLTLPLRMGQGHGLIDTLLFYFTYFTILTNLMLVLIYASEFVSWRWICWWRSPVTRGMMAGAIALVMGFYHVVLASLWNPQGAQAIADTTLHYVAPTLYLLWWLFFLPKGALRFGDIGWMILPPTGWLVWAMARGAVLNEYPYPILEAHIIGYPRVVLNIGVVLVIMLALFAAVVAIDRVLGPRMAGAAE